MRAGENAFLSNKLRNTLSSNQDAEMHPTGRHAAIVSRCFGFQKIEGAQSLPGPNGVAYTINCPASIPFFARISARAASTA